MSNLLWSYATLHVYNAPLVEAAVQYIQTPEVLRRWPAGGLGNTAWALAVLGCRDRAVFRALAERAVHPAVLQAFSAWDMSNLMWAFATAGVQDMVCPVGPGGAASRAALWGRPSLMLLDQGGIRMAVHRGRRGGGGLPPPLPEPPPPCPRERTGGRLLCAPGGEVTPRLDIPGGGGGGFGRGNFRCYKR